jgi:hypothetical protein
LVKMQNFSFFILPFYFVLFVVFVVQTLVTTKDAKDTKASGPPCLSPFSFCLLPFAFGVTPPNC